MDKNQTKSIVLIGFMGAGKTTTGKLLAQKLGRSFVDLDEKIEEAYALPVAQIFQTKGEKAFREKEKELILQFIQQEGLVLSLGGGAFLQEKIRTECLASGLVVYLDMSWDAWKERIQLIQESRPVLHGKTLDEMKELFLQRRKIYAEHHFKAVTDNLSPEEVAEFILDRIKNDSAAGKMC